MGKWKNMGYFHAYPASKLLKLAFLSYLTRKYVLWKGFYHDLRHWKGFSFRGALPQADPPPRGSAPWTPAGGAAPWTPRFLRLPPNDLPWRRPWSNQKLFLSRKNPILKISELLLLGVLTSVNKTNKQTNKQTNKRKRKRKKKRKIDV